MPSRNEITMSGLNPGSQYKIEVIGVVTTQGIDHFSPPGEAAATTSKSPSIIELRRKSSVLTFLDIHARTDLNFCEIILLFH